MLYSTTLFLLFLLATPAPADAKKEETTQLKFVKLDEKAANGDCLPQLDQFSAFGVLDKYGIKFSGQVKTNDKLAVARVIASIDELAGGKCELPRDASFAFRVGKGGVSRFDGTHVQINPSNQNETALREENKGHGGCNNTGLIAHELCHRMGNQRLSGGRGISAYEHFRSRVPTECALTRYAIHNKNDNPRNEEFAEICSAYITNPEIIMNNTTESCKKALDFFKEVIGDKSRYKTTCRDNLAKPNYNFPKTPTNNSSQ